MTETINRSEDVPLSNSSSEAIETVEKRVRERHDVAQVVRAKAVRYKARDMWEVMVCADLKEGDDA